MTICIEANKLTTKQKQFLLDNFSVSKSAQEMLTYSAKVANPYLFYTKEYRQIWWNDKIKGVIVSFDEFVTKINEYKLMDML